MINTKLPIKVTENEIDISYRTGQFVKNKKRCIKVKFVRRHVQNALFKNSKLLKGTRIYEPSHEKTRLMTKKCMFIFFYIILKYCF